MMLSQTAAVPEAPTVPRHKLVPIWIIAGLGLATAIGLLILGAVGVSTLYNFNGQGAVCFVEFVEFLVLFLLMMLFAKNIRNSGMKCGIVGLSSFIIVQSVGCFIYFVASLYINVFSYYWNLERFYVTIRWGLFLLSLSIMVAIASIVVVTCGIRSIVHGQVIPAGTVAYVTPGVPGAHFQVGAPTTQIIYTSGGMPPGQFQMAVPGPGQFVGYPPEQVSGPYQGSMGEPHMQPQAMYPSTYMNPGPCPAYDSEIPQKLN